LTRIYRNAKTMTNTSIVINIKKPIPRGADIDSRVIWFVREDKDPVLEDFQACEF